MKKSFLKKLSFVLASAMVFSTVAPAAGAFAASKPKLNSAKEYLFLGSGNDVQYDFNVKNTKTGWKYKWTSADKAIATVDKNGVVKAVGVGTAKVSVIISDKKGEEVSELKASVIVKDNIASLKVTNTPAGDKISVNKENAFAYTYTTKGGSTTKTTSVVKWSVDKTDATISADGKFVAKKAGAYKVTASAFQSEATYNTWLTSKAANLVLATADYTVTVPNEVKAVSAAKSNAIKIEFASAVTAVESANVTVTNSTTGTKVYVKSVVLSDDKTYATINLYDSLISGNTYKVAAKVDSIDMAGEVKYVKGTPTKIVAAANQVAAANTSYPIAYQVLDENGMDITADTTVSIESALRANDPGSVNSVKYLATGLIDYVYVVYTDNKTAKQIKSDRITVTSVDKVATDVATYTLSTVTGSSVDFSAKAVKTSIGLGSANDNKYYVRFKYKDQYGVEKLAPNTDENLSFETLDSNIFVIDQKSGLVHPQGVGTGSFRIKYGNINMIKTITVRAEEKVASLAIKWGNVKDVSDTGSKYDGDNGAWVVTEAFNQYGEEIVGQNLIYELTSGGGLISNGDGTTTLAVGDRITTIVKNNVTVPISSNDGFGIKAKKNLATAGTAVLKVSLASDPNIFTTCLFNVSKADNNRTSNLVGFQYGGSELDINNKFDGDGDTGADTVIKVWDVNSKNQKIAVITDASITVTGPNGKELYLPNIAADKGFKFDPTVDTYGKDWAYRTGTYTVVARRNNVQIGNVFTFTVKDSGVLPTITFASDNDVVGGQLTTTKLEEKLSGLDGYKVIGFKGIPADSSKVTFANPSNEWETLLTYSENTNLYNFKIKVAKDFLIEDGKTVTREFVIDLYTGVDLIRSY